MEVRRATIHDVKAILDYVTEYHEDSNLSDIPIDRVSLLRVVEHFIQHRDSLPLIAEAEGKIHGVLFGSLEPYFFNSKRMYATDLMFFSKGAGPQLWREFKDWAFATGADRILMGVSSGDDRACQLLEVLGMEPTGGMYVLRR